MRPAESRLTYLHQQVKRKSRSKKKAVAKPETDLCQQTTACHPQVSAAMLGSDTSTLATAVHC
jgi:hypothetical protein